ncbi:MAG: glycosyltransferase family 9 protein [Pirellulales bacterium]
MALSPEPHVLIVRLSAIGDCILTMPMATAIKRRYPGARITWVVEKNAASLLQNHKSIDQLIELPRGWLKSPSTLLKLKRTLRQSKFDVAFDPQSLTKSALVAWLSGASRRIGLARPIGRELAPTLNHVRIEPTFEHVVDRQLEMLSAIGVRLPEVQFDVPESLAAKHWVTTWLDQSPLAAGFVVMNPGATWDSRLWPTARFGQLAARIAEATGLRSLVTWGGARERGLAQEIVDHSLGQASMAPETSLPELASVLRRAQLYIGSDTGPMHLAAAVGTSCVGLFGTTRPEVSGPYGIGHRAVQAYYQAGTSRERRSAPNTAMLAITIDMALEACLSVLKDTPQRAAA